MSTNKMMVQGFGTGTVYGTPTTIGLALCRNVCVALHSHPLLAGTERWTDAGEVAVN